MERQNHWCSPGSRVLGLKQGMILLFPYWNINLAENVATAEVKAIRPPAAQRVSSPCTAGPGEPQWWPSDPGALCRPDKHKVGVRKTAATIRNQPADSFCSAQFAAAVVEQRPSSLVFTLNCCLSSYTGAAPAAASDFRGQGRSEGRSCLRVCLTLLNRTWTHSFDWTLTDDNSTL